MGTHSRCFTKQKPVWFDFLLGMVTGAVIFLLVNTAASLDVTNDAWILGGYIEKDILQHYTGWLFYRTSPIDYPLGIATQINAPDGCAVTFTDSIPILAILFRFIEPLLPATFQYFGLYNLLCYMLQGGASALLLRQFTKSSVLTWLGTVIFCLAPIFVERSFRHTALASHYLILFALLLYFKNQKQGFRFRYGYYLLLGLATAIHPYFLPMLFAILFADLVQYAAKSKRFLPCLGFLGGSFAVVLVIAYSIGIFSLHTSGGADGYGYFTMNLNALFNPSSKGMVWSQLLPVRPQALGSYDGFNYLGLGILAALPLACLYFLYRNRFSGALSLLRQHGGLAFVCLCLTVFAVSSTVIYSGLVLFSIPLPDFILKLCNTFRSSGRMFYPVYYLLLLFVFAQLSRLLEKKKYLALAIGILLVFVQVWDISPALEQKRAFFTENTSTSETVPADPVWDTIAQEYHSLTEFGGLLAEPVSLAHYAAKNQLTNNLTWAARSDADRILLETEQTLEQLRNGQLDLDTVYLTDDEVLFHELAEALSGQVYAIRADQLWYLLLPIKEGLECPVPSGSCWVYPDFPLMIVDYSDDLWTGGIFNSDPARCAFLDNAFTRSHLTDAEYLLCDGVSYQILEKDYRDAGWVMVTLDIEDASILCGKALTVR